MPYRRIFLLAASVIIGIACAATASSDAFAYLRGGYERAQAHQETAQRVVPAHRGAALGVPGRAKSDAGAHHAPRCGQSPCH